VQALPLVVHRVQERLDKNCVACRPGDNLFYYPPALPRGTRPCNLQKSVASKGYYMAGALVRPCVFPCLSCDSATACLGCYRGYFLDASNNCVRCTAPCYDCLSPGTHCTSCHMGYQLELNNTCSQICEDYEYFDTVRGYCMLCSYPCQTCSGGTPNDCLSCYLGLRLLGTKCVGCHETCSTCSGPLSTDCITCLPYLTLQTDGSCLRSCTLNSYYNASAQDCFVCHKYCKTCVGPSPYNCTDCETGFTFSANTFTPDLPTPPMTGFCKKTCPPGIPLLYPYPNECVHCHYSCATCLSAATDACLTCTDGFYQNGGYCEPCHAYCATCKGSSPFDCLSCPSGYDLETTPSGYCKPTTCAGGPGMNYGSNDCSTCHSSCRTCSGPSSTECYSCTSPNFMVVTNMSCVPACPIQMYYNATEMKCLNCDPSCAHCSGPGITECTQCMSAGYFIQVNSSLCDLGCANRSYIDPGNSTNCQPCDDTCETCIGPTDHHCDSCYDPQVLDYDLSCQAFCSPNYFADYNRRCVQCTYSCKNCSTVGFDRCTECFEDRFFRNDSLHLPDDGPCILKCMIGFYYASSADSCQVCDVSCRNCTGPNPVDCTSCADGYYVQVDGTCKDTCPPGTYKYDFNQTCQPCYLSCRTCSNGTEVDCLSCSPGLFLRHNGTCDTFCDEFLYPDNTTSTCEDCDKTCRLCSGPSPNQCIECRDQDTYFLTNDGRCLDCFQDAEKYPDICNFSVVLKLQECSLKIADSFSSESLQLTYHKFEETYPEVAALDFKSLVNVSVQGMISSDFTWRVSARNSKFILDLNFSKETTGKVEIRLNPIKRVILKNPISNLTELIFINKSAIYFTKAAPAPNPSVISSLKSLASGAEASSSSFAIVTASLCAAVVAFPSLVSPIMRLFRIFKLLSRLRLINIYFGCYLEIFLSVCNLLFSLGGDDISREALETAPDSRGKLKEYLVTPISVKPLIIKVSLFFILTAVRVYRQKIRKYAVKASTLTRSDWIANKVAESVRITMVASLSLDILFYSAHSLIHINWNSKYLAESSRHSIWISFFALAIITMDCIALLYENHDCHFDLLRYEFRMQRMVEAINKKKEIKEKGKFC
jgi:hypothetical protein